MTLRTMPPNRAAGPAGDPVARLIAWLRTFPPSDPAKHRRTGPFSSEFSTDFDRTDP